MFSMQGKKSADNILKYFLFFQKIGFEIKNKILFSAKNKKNINLLSADFAHRVVKRTTVNVLKIQTLWPKVCF